MCECVCAGDPMSRWIFAKGNPEDRVGTMRMKDLIEKASRKLQHNLKTRKEKRGLGKRSEQGERGRV